MTSAFKALPVVLAAALAATATLAEPTPPVTAPGIVIVDFGIYCSLDRVGTKPAPGTSMGHVRLLPDTPEFLYRQQQVPARLGVSFGISSFADRDIPEVRIEVWIPGASQPEMWYSEMTAGDPAVRGFTFDHDHERITGLWRMEAWEDARLLYRVEFDVLPGSDLPGVTSDCAFVA